MGQRFEVWKEVSVMHHEVKFIEFNLKGEEAKTDKKSQSKKEFELEIHYRIELENDDYLNAIFIFNTNEGESF